MLTFLHTGYIFLFFCKCPISPNGRPYVDLSLAEASKMSPEDVDLLPSMGKQPPMSCSTHAWERSYSTPEEVPVAYKEDPFEVEPLPWKSSPTSLPIVKIGRV
jgi:hypothetical protein